MIHQMSRSANQQAQLITENWGKDYDFILPSKFYTFTQVYQKWDSLCHDVQSVLTSTNFHLSYSPSPNSEQLIWKSTPTPTAGGRDNIGLQSLSDKLG